MGSKRLKKSTAFTLTIIAAIIITILLNILFSLIPTSYTHIDTTHEKLFTLSEQTMNIVQSVDNEIKIYHLCANGVRDENISELLLKYASLNSNIKIIVKDTSLYPNFYKKYTDVSLADNSVIVEGAKRYMVISYYDIYQTSSTEYEYYGYYDIFDGESQITSAIDYITCDDLPKVYYTEGHGESDISSTIQNYIESENINIEALNLNGLENLPDDADCVMLYAPKRDISTAEKEMFIEYMNNGGNLLILTDYNTEHLPVFDELLAYYGIQLTDGIVFEGSSGTYVPKYPYFIYPVIMSHTITDPISEDNLSLLFPICVGIKETDEKRESLTVNGIIKSTDSSYSKVDITSESFSKEENDINGPFNLAVAVTDTLENGESKLVLFSTTQFLDDNINTTVGRANTDLFLNSLGWLCNKESSITIHNKNMYSLSVTVSESMSWIMFAIIVILLPSLFIITAVVITNRRKMK